jgi:hypothetical protein
MSKGDPHEKIELPFDMDEAFAFEGTDELRRLRDCQNFQT